MKIGFMQGRLSSQVDGKIQAFPRDEWRDEFPRAAALGLTAMEWTLDANGLDENPLMISAGRREIRELSEAHGVGIPSVTGDFLMHAPPLEAQGAEREARLMGLERVIDACGELGIRYLVWPLVDEGRLRDSSLENTLIDVVSNRLAPRLRLRSVQLAFESDYAPAALAALVDRLPQDVAGINYDTGNSAALGYAPQDELRAYGRRVVNVHVKDRLRRGNTVPLGSGAADFAAVFEALRSARYDGYLILQTARAADGDHAGALGRYRDFVMEFVRIASEA